MGLAIAVTVVMLVVVVATSRAWTRVFGWPALTRGSPGLSDNLCCLVMIAEGLGGLYLYFLLRRF